MDPISRVASREVYRNPWMIVREDDVRRQDGSAGIYGVIDKPTYALVIARGTATSSGWLNSFGIRSVCAAGSFRRARPQGRSTATNRRLPTSRRANSARRRVCARNQW